MSTPMVSIIIPTYNEADNIKELLVKLQKVLGNMNHEIIIIDDDSPDLTWQKATSFKSSFPQLHVIRRIEERGLSSAVITGMAIAKGDVLAVMDADMQHDESILPDMVQAISEKKYDIAVGSRKVGDGSYGEFSFLRILVSQVAAFFTELMLHIRVKDSMSGFFAINRKHYEKKVSSINAKGFKILMEFLGRSPQAKVIEIPYTFRKRIHGQTKLSPAVIRHFFMALWDLRFGKWIPSIFILYASVGFSGIFVNLLGFSIGESINLPEINTQMLPGFDPIVTAVLFGIELSIISNYILNNYITFYEYRHTSLRGHLYSFSSFQLISLLGLFIQLSIFQLLYTNHVLTDMLPNDLHNKYLSNFLGIMIATISNYYLNTNYTWKKV